MATLTINGQKVTVDDSFLSLPPEQQNATVDEIAKSLAAQQPNSAPQAAPQPGSREYALWARDQAIAGKQLPQVSPDPNIRDTPSSILDPLVQGTTFGWADEMRGAVQGGLAAMQGKDFGQTYNQVVDESRQSLAQERKVNPVGSFVAELAGAVPTGMGLGGNLVAKGATLGARAIGGMLVGAGQGALYGAGAGEGDLSQRAMQAVPSAIVGGAVGAAAPYVGNWVDETIQGWKQGRVLDQAARNAPLSSEIKSAASDLLEQATGGQPLMITDNAYFRFLGGVKSAADKLRINPDNDQQSVGLLKTLMGIADDTANGIRPDIKDLHLLRQLAGKVAQSPNGRDSAFGTMVIKEIDNLITSLKPGDILGGTDPTQTANTLMKGISAWSRATKVAIVEEAIRVGEIAASGPEKGIRNAFRALMKRPDVWGRFSAAEQKAISDVVNGTPGSNLLKLIGTFGFGGNVATNGIGGAAGMAIGNAVAPGIGLVAGPVIGAIAKKGSEKMTSDLAKRALGAVATDGLKVIPPVNQAVPSLVESALRYNLPGLAGLPANR